MIDRITYLHLQDVIRREGRSFLQYAGESFPWNSPQDGAVVATMQQLVSEEREGAAALARFLVKHHLTPPYLGAYPSYFTSYNYMSLDRLVPLLIQFQVRGIGELEADLKAVEDEQTRHLVQGIVDMKKRHLAALQGLAAPAAA